MSKTSKPLEKALNAYAEADRLLKTGDEDSISQALSLLANETECRPNDAKASFELAGAYDFLGQESEALVRYQRVIELGFDKLPLDDQPRLFVQMGSTLRNLKQFDQAKKILTEGIRRFPKTAAIKLFLGLTEYSHKNYQNAARLFLQASLYAPDDVSLREYARALRNYSEQIDAFPNRDEETGT